MAASAEFKKVMAKPLVKVSRMRAR